jgi:hypothetical protein
MRHLTLLTDQLENVNFKHFGNHLYTEATTYLGTQGFTHMPFKLWTVRMLYHHDFA